MHVPVRMTVVRLDGGGLLVYAPVAPTAECLRLLAELEAAHGEVKHILLLTLTLALALALTLTLTRWSTSCCRRSR